MKNIRFSLFAVIAILFTGFSSLQAQDMDKKTVVDLAMSNPDLSTLVTAIKKANLAGALSDDGPYTVFAPTNEAFADLPAGLLDALLLPQNQKTLVDILAFHVVEKKVPAADVMAGIKADRSGRLIATTMNGNITLMTKDGKVMAKGEQGRVANVISTDMMAGNGVVHVIDKVLLPNGVDAEALLKGTARGMKERMKTDASAMADDAKMKMDDKADEMRSATMDNAAESMNNTTDRTMNTTMNRSMSSTKMKMNKNGMVENSIVDVATNAGTFTSLTGAVVKADLAPVLGGYGEYTVFAPSDDAFGKLPQGTVEGLNDSQLKGVLTYHVLPFTLTADQLIQNINSHNGYFIMPTVSGSTLVASMKGGKVMITDGNGNSATVETTDVQASNGVIHAIDTVLMPRTM